MQIINIHFTIIAMIISCLPNTCIYTLFMQLLCVHILAPLPQDNSRSSNCMSTEFCVLITTLL
jgi:hypothetical protein